MHIAISGSFWPQPDVGSGQYLHGLLAGLPRMASQHRYTLLVPAFAGASPPAPPGVNLVSVATPLAARSRQLAKVLFEQITAPQLARALGADLLHVPYFAPPLRAPLPVVATVLDLVPLLLPAYRGSRAMRGYVRLVAAAARRTPQLIAISQHSAHEIAQHLPIDPARITVTPLAAGSQYTPGDTAAARVDVLARYGVAAPFIYYVGGLDARKDVATLVRAFAQLVRAGDDRTTLAVAGQARGTDRQLFPDLDAVIADEGIGARVRRIVVPGADAALLYRAATVFAFPSRYEGFGLPPLEAMACGTPTLVAAVTSLPEVVAGGALLVPPGDVAAWAAALTRVLGDAALRADLRVRGLQRAAMFSYDATARGTLDVYARVA